MESAEGLARDVAVRPEQTRVSVRRYIAHLVDWVLLVVIIVVLAMAVGLLPDGSLRDTIRSVVLWGGITIGQLAYFVLLQEGTGQTPGKVLLRIRVVDGDGRAPTRRALLKRAVPLVVEYLYVIALIGMLSSPYRQRFGDRWAGTYVIADG